MNPDILLMGCMARKVSEQAIDHDGGGENKKSLTDRKCECASGGVLDHCEYGADSAYNPPNDIEDEQHPSQSIDGTITF